MKVLLDENLDHRLRGNLGAYEVFTVSIWIIKSFLHMSNEEKK